MTAADLYLDPKEEIPIEAQGVKINGVAADSQPELPNLLRFTSVVPTFEVTNWESVTLDLSVDGELRFDEWQDAYLLLHYEIST